ncbi:hypothetical protein ACJMK2_042294 [Sinanodonta woodiana]|uniref:NACHT domain-containing protein n=1 Tax=Sinanodonta woodiana TaxID=1069815 RepID=A0ABD3W6W5_SINWO
MSLKYHAVRFLLVNLYLIVLISPTVGFFDTDSEAVCEYEDANLIWRNTPTYSLNDVKAMAWYKGKGSLIATWMEGKGFIEYAPYVGRLMQIGETGIKIMTTKRSDSGTYWLSLTLGSADHKLEAKTDLVVIVAPSSFCKPNLTREGSFLKADLPAVDCDTSRLTLQWKYDNKTIIQKASLNCIIHSQNSSSVLYLGIHPEPAEYIACVDEESVKCYQGNLSDLCASYKITNDVQSPVSDHESGTLTIALVVIVLLVVVAISAIVVVMRCRNANKCRNIYLSSESKALYRKSNDRLYFLATGGNTENETEKEDICSIEEREYIGEVLLGIQNHLRELYKSLMTVSLSPPDEEGYYVDVSNLYVNINVEQVECTYLNKGNSDTYIDVAHASQTLISNDEGITIQIHTFCPIIIFGDCGSGKSTWCKHIVNCWLHKSGDTDASIQGLNLPDIRNIQIILYLTLQFSDRGLSLQELLLKYLFKEKAEYREFLRKYVKHHPQDVLIIVDGLDIIREYSHSISEMLHDELLCSCNAIIMSRPASFQLLQNICHDKLEQTRVFRVREMDIETSKHFARELIKRICGLQGNTYEKFWKFVEHFQVQSLLKVPYLCLLIFHVWMKNENPYIETTDILFRIVNYYLLRAMMDPQRKELIKNVFGKQSRNVKTYIAKLSQYPKLMQHEHFLRVLSCVAAKILLPEIETKHSTFKVTERLAITNKNYFQVLALCETGLLTESFVTPSNRKQSYLLSFSDRIIFEFFVTIFIVLQEGKECEFIVSSGSSCLQNSMIIHMLFELSDGDKVVTDVIDKARNNLESRNSMGNTGRKAGTNCCITQKSTHSDPEPIRWLQWLMYNDVLDEKRLLFLTPALYCSDALTSLVLELHENDKNLVFRLPFLSMIETLIVDIQKCTLLLCKEWDNRVPRHLKDAVIKSVNINIGTICLLMKAFGLCPDLESLELVPSENVTADDNYITPTTSGILPYSWNKLSKDMRNKKKLKTIKLKNLILVGEVYKFLSHLNCYPSIESVDLDNAKTIIEQTSSELHLSDTDNKGNEYKPKDKIESTNLELEKHNITHSPNKCIFSMTKKHKQNLINTNLKVLSLTAINMPDGSWRTFGNQISSLPITDLHLRCVHPRESLNILLEGISKCEKLQRLSLCEMDTGKSTPDFSFLAKLKELLKLHMQGMNINSSSSGVLFKSIRKCRKLHTLSFCNIDIEATSNTFSPLHKLKNLSELILDHVTMNKGSGSLSNFCSAFRQCRALIIYER